MALAAVPAVIAWGVAYALAAGAVSVAADRWAAALIDAPERRLAAARPSIAASMAAGFAGGALLANRGADAATMAWVLLVGASLLLVALVDLSTKLIPLAAVAAVLAVGLARAATSGALATSLVGAFAGAAVFAVLWALALPLRARAGTTPFGFGDVLLAAGIGAVVGWPSVLATLFLGALLGAVGSILLLATRSARATDAIPYGVFLCAAALLAEVVGA